MITPLVSSSGNFLMTSAYNIAVSSTQAQWMAQKLQIRLRIAMGEWYLNPSLGLPYFPVPGQPQIPAILGQKTTNQAYISALLKALILGTPGIVAIQQFNVSIIPNPSGPQPGSILQGSFTAQMEGGQVVTVELPEN